MAAPACNVKQMVAVVGKDRFPESSPIWEVDADTTAFITRLAPDGEVTFQAFDDRGDRKDLARVRHGSHAEHAAQLDYLNSQGAGIFVMANRGDGRGRKARNVVGIRSVFTDLDGASLEPVIDCDLPPQIIVESSPGKFHCYWLVADCPLERFTPIQRALAAKFGGDPVVHDLPRVMRLPGYLHRKGEPFRTRIIQILAEPAAYRVDDLVRAMGLQTESPEPRAVAPRQFTSSAAAYATAAINAAINAIAAAPNGQQRFVLNKEAFGIGQLVAAKQLSRGEARTALIAAGASMFSHDPGNPWRTQQIERIVDRAFTDAASRPRGRT